MQKIVVLIVVIVLSAAACSMDNELVESHKRARESYLFAKNGPAFKWDAQLRNETSCSLKEKYDAAFRVKRAAQVRGFRPDLAGFTLEEANSMAVELGKLALTRYLDRLRGENEEKVRGECETQTTPLPHMETLFLFQEIEYIIDEIGAESAGVNPFELRTRFRDALSLTIEKWRREGGNTRRAGEIRLLVREYNFPQQEFQLSSSEAALLYPETKKP